MTMRVLVLFTALVQALAPVVHALYPASSPVTELTESNFENKVKRGAWLVEFYAPWSAFLALLACLPEPRQPHANQGRAGNGLHAKCCRVGVSTNAAE